jgi:hypothetical protein
MLSRLIDWISSLLRTQVPYRCGHSDVRRLRVSLWGHDLGVKRDPHLARERCGLCEVAHLEEVSVRCAEPACGRPILPGDAICVVIPSPSWCPAPWARWISESVVLGSCCGYGSDYSGHWGLGRYSMQSMKDLPR